MKSYQENETRKIVEAKLNPKLHFNEEYHPIEELYQWRGNSVHLDVSRNPEAKAKIILLHVGGINGRKLSLFFGGLMFKL